MTLRIAIVEDNRMLRENLVLLLGGERDMEVCCHFETAEEALSNLSGVPPDILLVDLGLPGMSGVELIRRIKERYSHVEIMVHTVFEDREKVFAAIKAGASGYILKGATPRELIESIHGLAKGGAPMSPKIARAVVQEFQDVGLADHYILTAREREILAKLEQGLTYKELAEQLTISPHTVHTHIKNIYEKLHAKGRRDALSKARKKGII